MNLNNILWVGDIHLKLTGISASLEQALCGRSTVFPAAPARKGVVVLPLHQHPPKKGLSHKEGRGRLLHDLANIELQAMELGLRTLMEFPQAPPSLKQELIELSLSEAQHLKLCLEGLHDMGFQWGDWPIHLALWDAVAASDTLLERLFIVHRYLEGSGLDAQDKLLRRLVGVGDRQTELILQTIHRDEINHVYFGSFWFQKLIQDEEGQHEIYSYHSANRLNSLLVKFSSRLPIRREPLCHRWRLQAGFSPEELEVLEAYRGS